MQLINPALVLFPFKKIKQPYLEYEIITIYLITSELKFNIAFQIFFTCRYFFKNNLLQIEPFPLCIPIKISLSIVTFTVFLHVAHKLTVTVYTNSFSLKSSLTRKSKQKIVLIMINCIASKFCFYLQIN